MTLREFGTLLSGIVPAYHMYTIGKDVPRKFTIWSEKQADVKYADGIPYDTTVRGVLNYFTDAEYDTTVDDIFATLSNNRVYVRLTDVSYDDAYSRTVYTWEWSFNFGKGKIYS